MQREEIVTKQIDFVQNYFSSISSNGFHVLSGPLQPVAGQFAGVLGVPPKDSMRLWMALH
jgi:hypothetical protein